MVNLSIITINYNNEDGLLKTIKSVIDQQYRNFEYIIIDGGSSDNSTEIIKNFKDHFIYSVSEPDNGIYNAMNKGILKARGEYCFFLNSGDSFVSSDVLEKVFSRPVDFDIIYGRLLICDKRNKIIEKAIGKSEISLLDVYNHTIKHQSSFIKRELFNRYGLYDESLKIISDWVFFMKSVGLGKATIKYLDIDIAYFINDGISNNSPEICIKERKLILDSILPPRILTDYVNFSSVGRFLRIENHKFSRVLLRGLNKSVKLYEKVFKNRELI